MIPPPEIWFCPKTEPSHHGKPCLFLDRDGVIVKEKHYLSHVQDVALEVGSIDLIKAARALGLSVVIITNQSGIARGLFSLEEFIAVEEEIKRLLKAENAEVDLTIACPYHPDFTPNFTDQMDRWRKPGPAMLEFTSHQLGIRLDQSWIVGDRASDIEAGQNAGIAGAIHVATGHGQRERLQAARLATSQYHVELCATPAEAARRLHDLFSQMR